MESLIEPIRNLFQTGGWVMWPLAFLSLLSVTLIVERFLFWGRAATATRRRWHSLARKIRQRDLAGARALAEDDHTFLGVFALALVEELKQGPLTEVAAREAVEQIRPGIERFSATLSTIITAAPMLGILGTVTGIIRSFEVVGAAAVTGGEGAADPTLVADGIAQALYTTAFGLLIAIVTLFPYVIFRARIERALGRLELLAAAGMEEIRRGVETRPAPAREAEPVEGEAAAATGA
ncbi:MAG: MotA/TolQ/ExbB proton channel family protein [Phycisphaerales bacterium JB039]